jgi:putative flippase GtrA
MAGRWERLVPGAHGTLRHGLAFVAGGGIAFAVDALVLQVLTAGAGLHPVVARLAAIALAMVAGWLAHRTFTFKVAAPPSLPEFLRYAAVGWGASAVNYGVFVAIVLAWPAVAPFAALVVASLVAMVFAYLGMRFGAFRSHE